MTPTDFTYLSKRNDRYRKKTVEVASGAEFTALDISEAEVLAASNIIYIHINRKNLKCYVGITIMRAKDRWSAGNAYRFNKSFGNAIRKWGWENFSHHILAFIDHRDDLNKAEMEAIEVSGGHKSKLTYNLSPGGDTVAENDKPLVGVFLETGEQRNFNGGAEAVRELGLAHIDAPMAVARKERAAVSGWWFRFIEDEEAMPPEIWGEDLRVARVREVKGKTVIATNYKSGEKRKFPTTADAAKALRLSQSTVSQVAIGRYHSAGGWWFCFEGDEREMPKSIGTKAAREKRDRKVFAVNLNTKERRAFRNGAVASEELGLYRTAVTGVISGKRTSAAGWWFTYDRNEEPPKEYKGALVAKARSKPVIAELIETGKSQRFESAKLASEALGVQRSSISNIISGKKKSAKGYHFRIAEDV